MKRPTTRPKGHTMLELMVASTLMAITIVPALSLMRESLRVDRKIERRELMTTCCVSKMEEHLAAVAADSSWTVSNSAGTFTTQGYPNLHYIVVLTDDSSSLSGSGNLMILTTTVWDDENIDSIQQASEPTTVFHTKVAQMAIYQQ